MDRIDMHVHTTASDGTMSPRDVVSLAAMLGLKAVAITDQDTMAGIAEAGEAGELLGVSVVPGIELTADYQGKAVQVLGYFLDPEAQKLKDYSLQMQQNRRERNRKILDKLARKGYAIDLEALEAEYPGTVPDRTHIAQKLVELGAASSVKEAFRRYLGDGRSCFVPLEMVCLADAARLIRDCGGLAVLAHPLQYGFTRAELDALCQAAQDARFSGMEVLYPGYTQADISKLYELAEKYLFLPTGGTGFRGEAQPDIQLGSGDGKLAVPAYMLIMLAASQYQ